MSRVGSKPIQLAEKVSVKVGPAGVEVTGPKGTLTTPLFAGFDCEVKDGAVSFSRTDDSGPSRAKHGLVRALAANAVHGVTEGFERRLEIHGVGYRAAVQGKSVQFNLGYSHPIDFPMPDGITIEVEANTKILVKGIDKQQVGQVAANIRALRPPDSYKGKGVRYADEQIRLKAGKTGAK